MKKLFCVSRAVPTLPINLEDAARSDVEIEKAIQVHLITDPQCRSNSVVEFRLQLLYCLSPFETLDISNVCLFNIVSSVSLYFVFVLILYALCEC